MLGRSSLPFALVALLFAASPSAAAVTWRSTGVEYAKRFAPSNSPCFYTCPATVVYHGTSYMRSSSEGGEVGAEGMACSYNQ